MQDIKVYHQDGLIYFDNFRVTELILVNRDKDEYKLILDIQSFDYPHNKEKIFDLESRFKTKINTDINYVWVTLEELCNLKTIDDLHGFAINDASDNDKFLYFGWHIGLFNNAIQFKKSEQGYCIIWTATSGDVNYYDNRANENKVEINCDLNLFVFPNEDEHQKHITLKNRQREIYFSILRSLLGQAIPGQDNYDISEVSKRDLSEFEMNKYAWDFAIQNDQR
jgi:hypothetical protein